MKELNIERIIDNLNKEPRQIEEIIKELNNFISLIEDYLIYSKKEKILFSEFSELCYIMNLINMSGEKQLEYIMAFVEENINTGLLLEEPNKLKMSYDDYEKIINITQIYQITLTQEMLSEIYEKYRKKQSLRIWEEKVLEIMLNSIKETSDFRNLMKNINERYIKKQDNYTMDDLKEVIKTFETMGVTHESNKKIRRILVKKYKERINNNHKDEANKTIPIFAQTEEKKKRVSSLLTTKQYKEILNILKEYIIFDGMKLKKEVSQEERIMLASNLLLVGFNERDVKKFIYNSDLIYQFIVRSKKDKNIIKNISLKQLIKLYQGNINRYLYYGNNNLLEIDEILDTINLYIELSTEETDIKTLEEIKEEIYNNIVILNNIITHNYKYEKDKIEEEKSKKIQKIIQN